MAPKGGGGGGTHAPHVERGGRGESHLWAPPPETQIASKSKKKSGVGNSGAGTEARSSGLPAASGRWGWDVSRIGSRVNGQFLKIGH